MQRQLTESHQQSNEDLKREVNMASVLVWVVVLFITCQSIKIIPDVYEAFHCHLEVRCSDIKISRINMFLWIAREHWIYIVLSKNKKYLSRLYLLYSIVCRYVLCNLIIEPKHLLVIRHRPSPPLECFQFT